MGNMTTMCETVSSNSMTDVQYLFEKYEEERLEKEKLNNKIIKITEDYEERLKRSNSINVMLWLITFSMKSLKQKTNY